MVSYSSHEICKMTGASYRQVDYWRRTGLIEPSLSNVHGSGTKARWSADDLLGVLALVLLRDLGLELSAAVALCRGGSEVFRDVRTKVGIAEALWAGWQEEVA